MKRKTLPIIVAALAIGTSPLAFVPASAQDAPILPKKGSSQQGTQPQSDGATTQQPDAGAPATGDGSSGGELRARVNRAEANQILRSRLNRVQADRPLVKTPARR